MNASRKKILESDKQAELERKLALELEPQKTLLLQKQAAMEKLHYEKDKVLLEATGSLYISPPCTKHAKVRAGQAPTSRAT